MAKVITISTPGVTKRATAPEGVTEYNLTTKYPITP